jgi:hypothetical protein
LTGSSTAHRSNCQSAFYGRSDLRTGILPALPAPSTAFGGVLGGLVCDGRGLGGWWLAFL